MSFDLIVNPTILNAAELCLRFVTKLRPSTRSGLLERVLERVGEEEGAVFPV